MEYTSAPRSLGTSISNTDAATSILYDPAFTEEDANIVLQSSDGINYRLHSFTLRTTSGFFRAMMTLPSGSSLDQKDDIIVMDETSMVLGTLLRMIGGLEFPKWESFDELESLWAAAEKYDMPGPLAVIRTVITTPPILDEPLRLYALATRYGWEDVAKLASKYTLGLSILDDKFAPVLERVPTSYILRLFRLRQRRRDNFRELIERNTFGIESSCGGCGHEVRYEAFSNLIKSMVLSMDHRPDGKELLDGEWKVWPATKELVCTHGPRYCQWAVSRYENTIAARITSAINSLPRTI
jgi:hypothetical protein